MLDHQRSVSPDGRRIAYVSNRLGHDELWILRLGTKRLDRLELPGHDLAVSASYWFPDGQRLSVLRKLPDGKNSLWFVAADGSHAKELPIPSFIGPPDGSPVSPDGRTVTYPALSGGS